MKEIEKNYNPAEIEDRLYSKWQEKKYFHAEVDRSKKPFTIVMPPPNITGQLHMGHALDNTMQDILTRFKRMQGYEALWLPGTDHASIATEAKIVEKMREEGITKEDIGREKFLDRAWQWKAQYGGRIVSQLKKIGSSCDWDRERFTMDEGCSKAVKEVFVNLYNKGQIYRGERIINWCPHCLTSISDAEVEYEDQAGKFWHLRYPSIPPIRLRHSWPHGRAAICAPSGGDHPGGTVALFPRTPIPSGDRGLAGPARVRALHALSGSGRPAATSLRWPPPAL